MAQTSISYRVDCARKGTQRSSLYNMSMYMNETNIRRTTHTPREALSPFGNAAIQTTILVITVPRAAFRGCTAYISMPAMKSASHEEGAAWRWCVYVHLHVCSACVLAFVTCSMLP